MFFGFFTLCFSDFLLFRILRKKLALYTAKFFADKGKNITFICPSSIPEVYRPDILMDGKEWEIKSPIGKGKKTMHIPT